MPQNKFVSKLKIWRRLHQSRKNSLVQNRLPFFKITEKYLPSNEESIVVDIGSGEGNFANYLNLSARYKNLYLLDGSALTIDKINSKFKNAILYKAPQKLPFGNSTVTYIHCSHLIEHLTSNELYQFLVEINRVLAGDGIFVVSSPMLWKGFYDDLSHVRPYNPEVLINYLCKESKNRSAEVISEEYSILELAYRYYILEFDEGWGSHNFLIDSIIQVLKNLLSILSIRKYSRNGYTLVLKKGKI